MTVTGVIGLTDMERSSRHRGISIDKETESLDLKSVQEDNRMLVGKV